MKKILIVEGNQEFRAYLNANELVLSQCTIISNIADLIYHVFYSDTIFEYIFIGDDLMESNPCLGVDKEIDLEIGKLKKCEYFPVTLGEICKRLSNKAGKPAPEVTIITSFYYYPFHGDIDEAKAFIKSKHMKWIDKMEQGFSIPDNFFRIIYE